MTGLVLMRELIRNDQPRGHSDKVDRIFDRANFDSLFESALVREEIPYSPFPIALFFPILGVKTIRTCARTAIDVTHFARRYTARLPKLPRVRITPTLYRASTSAIERVHSMSLGTSPSFANVKRNDRPEWPRGRPRYYYVTGSHEQKHWGGGNCTQTKDGELPQPGHGHPVQLSHIPHPPHRAQTRHLCRPIR